MTSEELSKVIDKENQERFDLLVKCLFGGTEHQSGGIQSAYELIDELILKGYLTPSGLLHNIGNLFENELSKTTKAYNANNKIENI